MGKKLNTKAVQSKKVELVTDSEEAAAQKEHEKMFTQILIETWISNKIEIDRTYVTLATAGIGVLVTLMAIEGSIRDWFGLGLFFGGVFFFLLTIMIGLRIFRVNSQIVEGSYKREKDEDLDKYSKFLDRAIAISFGLGILASALCGGYIGFQKVNEKQEVSEEAVK